MIWKDKSARLPFAVAGVFLLIGSSITSIVMISLENKEAKNVSISMSSGEIEKLISSLKNDLAISLNYAGMHAMKYIGSHPVIEPNNKSNIATEYNGGSWKNYEDGWSIDEMIQFNINWSRNITRYRMNSYIEANYQGDEFNNGRYAINVEFIKDWRDIKVKQLDMELESNVPILDSIKNLFGDNQKNYPAYLIFYLPLKIEIKDMESGKIVGRRVINVSSLITSRLPLMMKLTQDFESAINNSNLLDNKLFLLFTLLSEIYTEGRALAQYGGMYEDIPNIVDNRWIRYLLNGAILFEEFMFFNSIDPVAAIYLLLNWGDLTATGFPEKDVKNKFQDASIAGEFEKMFGKPDENLLRTMKEDSRNEAKKHIDEPKPAREINITELAESLLYEKKFLYYYYNESTHSFHNTTKFEGYNVTIDGKNYYYIPPPPYTYYNESNNTTHIKKEDKYRGKKFNENNLVYHIVIDKTRGYDVELSGDLNSTLKKKIEEMIDDSYHVQFNIGVKREVIVSPHYINKSDYWDCRKGGDTTWSVSYANSSKYVKKGDVIARFPYTEEWEVEYEQWHKYGHRTPIYDENGTLIGYSCKGEKEFRYITKEKITFTVYASYPNDVKDAFNQTDVTLSYPRHDNNLFYISRDFVTDFIRFRENIIDTYGKDDSKNVKLPNDNGKNKYAMGWLRGINGEVGKALEEILDSIKRDNITARVGKDFKKKNANQNIDDLTTQLLKKYEAKMSKYMDTGRYMENGKYKSCGARVVAKMREWYVNKIHEYLKNASSNMKKNITKEISNKLKGRIKMDDFENAKNKLEGIDAGNLPHIQFGLTFSLKNSALNWNEEIGFSVDQQPNYFKPSKPGDTYKFLERNICVFGPTGLPILPTPITPWVITINAWYIHIEGQFSKFEIVDTIGEMHPSILFGETDQAYVRKEWPVEDPCNNQQIGKTTSIQFIIKTVNVAITPPGFVGDINPMSYPEEKEGTPLGGG